MNGIKVPGIFTPGTVNGFVTEARWVKGTYIVVNTVEEANQIPLTVRVDGTPVYVVETKTEYRWLNGDWEVKPQPLQDAPVDGKMYARLNGAWAEVTFDTHNLQEQIDDLYSKLDGKADRTEIPDVSGFATSEQLTSGLAGKQDTLESGTNIKTINGQSILGAGNIEIQGGSMGPATEDTLGGILATNLDAQEGTSAYVGVEEDGKAFVKIPNVSTIIDVEELPTENIDENVLYRKPELKKYLIQGSQKVADGETVDGATIRIIDVEVLPEVGIIFSDESTSTMTFYIQTSTMTAHIYRGAEEGWAEPSSLWGDSWGGVITSEDQIANPELVYILYTSGLVDIVYSMYNGKKNDMNGKPVTCIVVDTLPETGEACTDASGSFIKLYYQKQDGIAYGYLTAELSGSSAMWKTINELSVDFLGGDYFGGYIADDAEATDSTKLYIVHKVTYPTYKLYHHKYEWHEVGSGGDSGDGSSNMVVYDYSPGSSEYTADDVRSMYDNYSNGKRVLVNFITGFGNILIEVTSMARSTDGSGIVGSAKANIFGLGVMEFTLVLNNDIVQLVSTEYKFYDSFTVTINYDDGVDFQTYYWDSLDGWMQGSYGGSGTGSITGTYNYVIVKTECNLSSGNSPYFKVNGKGYFEDIPHDAPIRLHPGDVIEPIEHCSPTIKLSAAILDAPTIEEDSVLTNEMVNAMF